MSSRFIHLAQYGAAPDHVKGALAAEGSGGRIDARRRCERHYDGFAHAEPRVDPASWPRTRDPERIPCLRTGLS